MPWQNFGNLAAGQQNLSLFDTFGAQIGKCVLVPCTASPGNAVTLTGTTNAPAVPSYSDIITFIFIATGTSNGALTIGFTGLSQLNAYYADGVTQIGSGGAVGTGGVISGQLYTATWSQALNSGAGGFYLGRLSLPITGTQPTRQTFTSGSSLTYTTPANCRQLFIRMVGGGGAGGANAITGSNGTVTTFNAINANPGTGGGPSQGASAAPGQGGAGGSGGTGSATLRIGGGAGGTGMGVSSASFSINMTPGKGGDSAFGGASGVPGVAPAANSGAGGCGATNPAFTNAASGGGGGAGEYVELIINNPAATYIYTVGTGGVTGATPGAAGIIIVEERY